MVLTQLMLSRCANELEDANILQRFFFSQLHLRFSALTFAKLLGQRVMNYRFFASVGYEIYFK